MEKRAVIIIGIQGSGKSTFCSRYLGNGYTRINLDTLKTRSMEWSAVEECLKNGGSFVVDNTNPTRADRERYIIPAKEAGYRIIGYFMESKIKDCIMRNSQRTGKERIPDTAIAATSNKLQLPDFDEGFDELYFVSNDGEAMTIEKLRS